MFISTELKPYPALKFNVGYRRDKTKHKRLLASLIFDEVTPQCQIFDFNEFGLPNPPRSICPIAYVIDPNQTRHDIWQNEAYEYGSIYNLNLSISLYTSFAKTFRNPNVDELSLAPDNLTPQSSERYELGVRAEYTLFNIGLSLFESNTKNEIIFREVINKKNDRSEALNFNFPFRVKRQGAELQLQAYPSNDVNLNVNLGYLNNIIANDKQLPLVAKKNASFTANWHLLDSVNLSFSTRYVGRRLDGNDFKNEKPQNALPSYSISDAQLTWTLDFSNANKLTWYIRSNNVFNKQYISVAYSGTGYPSPERSFSTGVSLEL